MKNIICSTVFLLLISLSSTGAAFCVNNTSDETILARGDGGIVIVWKARIGPKKTKCCPETKNYCRWQQAVSIFKEQYKGRKCYTKINRKDKELMIYVGYNKAKKKWICTSGK